jgi:hypothetical protein
MSGESEAGKILSDCCHKEKVTSDNYTELTNLLAGREWEESRNNLSRLMGHVFREVKALIVQNGGFPKQKKRMIMKH